MYSFAYDIDNQFDIDQDTQMSSYIQLCKSNNIQLNVLNGVDQSINDTSDKLKINKKQIFDTFSTKITNKGHHLHNLKDNNKFILTHIESLLDNN